MRILIIDDHLDTADVFGMMLEHLGHETKVAYEGRAGLLAVQAFRPDLVLLDVGLPDISGYDVARAIRLLPEGRDVRVVAITGWGTRETPAAEGFDQHLIKPVGLAELRAVTA